MSLFPTRPNLAAGFGAHRPLSLLDELFFGLKRWSLPQAVTDVFGRPFYKPALLLVKDVHAVSEFHKLKHGFPFLLKS